MMRIDGDLLKDAGILDGNLLVVDRAAKPVNAVRRKRGCFVRQEKRLVVRPAFRPIRARSQTGEPDRSELASVSHQQEPSNRHRHVPTLTLNCAASPPGRVSCGQRLRCACPRMLAQNTATSRTRTLSPVCFSLRHCMELLGFDWRWWWRLWKVSRWHEASDALRYAVGST